MSEAAVPQKVAFLGLGVMGHPMAGHLKNAGHDVVVYNRTGEKAQRWAEEYGGTAAPTPAAAADGRHFVFLCVGDDPDVREVAFGADGCVGAMESGAVLVDHTTASADVAREVGAACEAAGLHFLDAPISGGQAGAENGALTVMCGGDEDTFGRALPVIDAYAKSINLIGPTGSGQMCKMVNQLCIAGLVQGLSEGIHFAQKSGLDVGKVISAISGGAAQSWQMDNRWQTMEAGDFDHGFAVEWMRKDLGIALSAGRQAGASLPVAALVDQFYAEVEAMGGERWDTSSLIARLNRD
ncbi:MAG: NAD(P)-dependent oxidoreductase [Acidobacteriota bacterium]